MHTPRHLAALKELTAKASGDDAEAVRTACLRQYDSVYLNAASERAARLAAGGALAVSSAVAEGRVQNGLALVRPPGHHAMKEEFNGYSLFNSVAVAARNAVKNCGVGRVLIVDFDVHHGMDFLTGTPCLAMYF